MEFIEIVLIVVVVVVVVAAAVAVAPIVMLDPRSLDLWRRRGTRIRRRRRRVCIINLFYGSDY